MIRHSFKVGVAVIALLWVLNVTFVVYLIRFHPDCARDQIIIPAGKHPLFGYRCLTPPPPEGQ